MNLYYKLTCVVLPAALIAACSASGSKKPSATAVASASVVKESITHTEKHPVETLAEKLNSTTVNIEIPEADKFPLTQVAQTKEITKPVKRVYQFGFNKHEIGNIDQQSLQAHADYLIAHPDTKLLINGHSDTQGNSDYNLFLSEERAKQIARFLIEYGAPEEQIEVAGLGDSQPLNDINNFKENRRVELQYSDSRVATK